MQFCVVVGFQICTFKTGVWLGLYSLRHPCLLLWMLYGYTLNHSILNMQNRQQKNISCSFQVRHDEAKESAFVCLSSSYVGFTVLVTLPATKPGHC